MRRGKNKKSAAFVTVETIYGGGSFAVELIKHICAESSVRGREISQHISPDLARAVLGGASYLATAKKLERFSRANYLFDLSVRAAVCALVQKEQTEGKLSVCKNFTIADIVNARMFGLEWRGNIRSIEKFSRTVWLDHDRKVEIVPDVVAFLDMGVPTAKLQIERLLDPSNSDSLLKQVDSATGEQIVDFFSRIDLSLQRRLFLEEVSKLPNYIVLDAELSPTYNARLVLDRVEALFL